MSRCCTNLHQLNPSIPRCFAGTNSRCAGHVKQNGNNRLSTILSMGRSEPLRRITTPLGAGALANLRMVLAGPRMATRSPPPNSPLRASAEEPLTWTPRLPSHTLRRSITFSAQGKPSVKVWAGHPTTQGGFPTSIEPSGDDGHMGEPRDTVRGTRARPRVRIYHRER